MVAANVNMETWTQSRGKILKATAKFDENDLYYRTLSQINLIKLNQISVQKDVKKKFYRNNFAL